MMAMSYGNVYVARVAMGANDAHTLKAFIEAEAYDGPSLIIAYSHCIAHGYDMAHGTGAAEGRRAVRLLAAVPLQPGVADSRQESVPARFTRRIDPAEGVHLQRDPLHHAASEQSRSRPRRC